MTRDRAGRRDSRAGDEVPADREPSAGRAAESPASRATGAGLKAALVHQARRLIEELGPDGLTLRAAAKAAGASHNAPYIYFPGGLTELHAAVAVQGFDELIEAIRTPYRPVGIVGIEDGTMSDEPAIVARVRDMVLSYVQFGVEHPHLYRAMFHARLAEPLHNVPRKRPEDFRGATTFQDLYRIKRRAFDTLLVPLKALERAGALRAPSVRRPGDVHEVPGLAIGALAHGLVGEFIDEGLIWREQHEESWSSERQTMASAITDMLLHGLVALLYPRSS